MGAGEPSVDAGAAAELQPPSDAVGLELVKLLADSQGAEPAPESAFADAPAYDGHVALALDLEVLPGIDSTLDLLISSHQLFDVPALDVSSVLDDSLPT
jgi:hypothetical protein